MAEGKLAEPLNGESKEEVAGKPELDCCYIGTLHCLLVLHQPLDGHGFPLGSSQVPPAIVLATPLNLHRLPTGTVFVALVVKGCDSKRAFWNSGAEDTFAKLLNQISGTYFCVRCHRLKCLKMTIFAGFESEKYS